MKEYAYKGYRIYPGDTGSAEWLFHHKEYSGPSDYRCGYGDSIEDCQDEIDQILLWESENELDDMHLESE